MSQASCRDVLPARPCSDSSLNSFPCHLYSLMTSAVLLWPVHLPLVLIPEGAAVRCSIVASHATSVTDIPAHAAWADDLALG